ncbi:MAG TPA: MXAN_5187 C-terminal domain-containing protein, partial [Kofleriaceae bacterium]|nr:MXAN_5187 C-terminal domain-containing protein [Kofleriaceae bacterium]
TKLILLTGGGALLLALLGIYLTHRRMIMQVDQIEGGVTDIINGNLDRTFRPVGAELDGLANGLNVMLARVLGRPEPGEEEFDEDGNVIIPGRVDFEEGEDKPAPDPDLAALVAESEPDYYKRVYTEYLAARKASGAPEDVSFENFIAKLKVNEGKLRAQHQCRAVRFRVVTKDGKVTLKPVPIFA